MLDLQTRVDELYERGYFERAFLIYRNELAAAGDKYAQYMVGYMILSGQGVPQNPVLASAWYRLAAERGTDEFTMVRDELLEDFDQAELQRSDYSYRELREKYSDAALLLRLIRKDLEELRGGSTGSRISSGGAPMTIIDSRTGLPESGDEFYGRMRQQLGARLKVLANVLQAEDLDTNPNTADLDDVERAVEQYLEVLPH